MLIWGEYAAFPQARLVGLAECGTPAILDAETGPCSKSDIALSRDLVGRLKPGTLMRADGSWLALIIPTSGTDRRRTAPLMVRVIDYTIDGGRENPESDRLFTTILDPTKATAEDLATIASKGWEIESTFDELKGISTGRRRCCVPNLPTRSSRKSGGASAVTTRSVAQGACPPSTL